MNTNVPNMLNYPKHICKIHGVPLNMYHDLRYNNPSMWLNCPRALCYKQERNFSSIGKHILPNYQFVNPKRNVTVGIGYRTISLLFQYEISLYCSITCELSFQAIAVHYYFRGFLSPTFQLA